MNRKWTVARTLAICCGILLAFYLQGVTSVSAAGNVDLVMTNVPPGSVMQNATFNITVQVQAGVDQVDLAEIHLDFDSSMLEVVSLTPGNTLQPLFGPPVSTAGRVDFTGAKFFDFPSGTFDLLTIEFRVITADVVTTTIAYASEFPRQTTATFGGETVLRSAENVQISLDNPLAISVAWFLAESNENQVDFQWQTATETGTAGFNVLAVTGNERAQLNSELIPSPAIDSVVPLDYSFTVETSATVFNLEEVEVDSSVIEHGPFNLGVVYGVHIAGERSTLSPSIWLPFIVR